MSLPADGTPYRAVVEPSDNEFLVLTMRRAESGHGMLDAHSPEGAVSQVIAFGPGHALLMWDQPGLGPCQIAPGIANWIYVCGRNHRLDWIAVPGLGPLPPAVPVMWPLEP